MNPKFILPVSFALAAHVFLLFGLPGRTPANVAPLPGEAPPPTEPTLRPEMIEVDRTPPEERGEAAEDPVPEPGGIRTLIDIPPVNPPPGRIPIAVSPPASNDDVTSGVNVIPPDWDRRLGPTGPVVVPSSKLDHVPRARVQAAPIYPTGMRDRGIEGSVVVEFLVDEAGNAFRPAIVSSTRREFEDAALRAVARWKFEPGFRNGRRVTYRMSVPVVFRLDRT